MNLKTLKSFKSLKSLKKLKKLKKLGDLDGKEGEIEVEKEFSLRAKYVVGCDGAHSFVCVTTWVGVQFPGEKGCFEVYCGTLF